MSTEIIDLRNDVEEQARLAIAIIEQEAGNVLKEIELLHSIEDKYVQ